MFWIVEHITEARKELVDCESNKMYHGIELHRKPLSLIHREFFLIRLMQSTYIQYISITRLLHFFRMNKLTGGKFLLGTKRNILAIPFHVIHTAHFLFEINGSNQNHISYS